MNEAATIVFDMQSKDFDTFTTVITPGGERLTNDDFGSNGRSLSVIENSASGSYEVEVSSYEGGQTGTFTLSAILNAR